MKNYRLQFFATPIDLKIILSEVETNLSIKFIPNKPYITEKYTEIKKLSSFYKLGKSDTGLASEQMYLVFDEINKPKVRSVRQINDDKIHYFVEGGVVLFLGGIYQQKALLMSEINTLGELESDIVLYKRVIKYIKKQCVNKKSSIYYSNSVIDASLKMRLVTNSVKGSIRYDFNNMILNA